MAKKKNDPKIDVFAFEIASKFFDPLLKKKLKPFRSISAEILADFIVKQTKEEDLGVNYYDYRDFIR